MTKRVLQTMRSARQTLICTAVLTALSIAGARSYAQAPNNLGLNDPHVPVATGNVKQPANTTLDSTKVPDPTDRSAESSPLDPTHHGTSIAVNSAVSVQLATAVNSASVKNGDTVKGVLANALKTSSGMTLAAGTPVSGTVVAAAKAGTVGSAGTLSLQLTKIGAIPVVTDVVDFNGKEGHKDVADAAPAKGTEAIVNPGTTLQFHVLSDGTVPGLVSGADVQKANGGPTVGSGAPGKVTDGGANNAPGVNQTAAPGMTTPR